MKRDITSQARALDKLIETLESPRHRHIIENYRRHAMLEISGQAKLIFAPEMTVEHPVYYVNANGMSLTLDGHDEVFGFYTSLEERQARVILVEDEQIAVADWGFASEAVFHSYLPGALVPPTAGPADPAKLYVLTQRIAMIWPYDEHGRMIGEHVYEHADHTRLVEVDAEEFITPDEAHEKLVPLIRPLPAFAG